MNPLRYFLKYHSIPQIVIPSGAGRFLFFALARANASACVVEESLFCLAAADEESAFPMRSD